MNTIPQLFFYSGTASQGSSQYTVNAANGSTFLFGGIILKWFSDTVGSVTKQFNFDGGGANPLNIGTFPNNAFASVVSITGANTNFIVTSTIVSKNLININCSVSAGTRPFTCFVIGN